MFKVQCPCGQTMSATEDQIAKQAKCPKCGVHFVVPLPRNLSTARLSCQCGTVMEYLLVDGGLISKCSVCSILFRIPGGTAESLDREMVREGRIRTIKRGVRGDRVVVSENAMLEDIDVTKPVSPANQPRLKVEVDNESWEIGKLVAGIAVFLTLVCVCVAVFSFTDLGEKVSSLFDRKAFDAFADAGNEGEPGIEASILAVPKEDQQRKSPAPPDVIAATPFVENILERTNSLITNGSFEETRIEPGSRSFEIAAGEETLKGWTVGRVSIELTGGVNAPEAPRRGTQLLDLDGIKGAGEVSQQFQTAKDARYELTFWYSNSPGLKSVGKVSIRSGDRFLVPELEVLSDIPNKEEWTWQLFRTEFQGDGLANTLVLSSENHIRSQNGLLIDDVSIIPVTP